jgi:DNA ligase 1
LKLFAELVTTLGSSTKTTDKLDALVNYFSHAHDRDIVWVIALFSGRKPKRPVNTTILASWAVEEAGLTWWLFEESYHVVGDLAETIALLLPDNDSAEKESKPLHYYLETLLRIEKESEEVKKDFILIQLAAI